MADDGPLLGGHDRHKGFYFSQLHLLLLTYDHPYYVFLIV
jgi:hypothetical protein